MLCDNNLHINVWGVLNNWTQIKKKNVSLLTYGINPKTHTDSSFVLPPNSHQTQDPNEPNHPSVQKQPANNQADLYQKFNGQKQFYSTDSTRSLHWFIYFIFPSHSLFPQQLRKAHHENGGRHHDHIWSICSGHIDSLRFVGVGKLEKKKDSECGRGCDLKSMWSNSFVKMGGLPVPLDKQVTHVKNNPETLQNMLAVGIPLSKGFLALLV